MPPAYRRTARHVRPRPAALTRALLALGAVLVTVTLGFGGYAVGTAVVRPAPVSSTTMHHAKVIQPGAQSPTPAQSPTHHHRPPAHCAPAVPGAAMLHHALHIWHLLHVAHAAHLAWLASHGLPVQTE